MSVACIRRDSPAVRLAHPPAVLAAAVIAGWFALTCLYLARLCPHELAPDEAHYWDWSRRLDWAYYSKGPAVALLIRAGCELFGDTPFGVRFPAAVCSTLLLAGVYRLAADHHSPRLGLWAVLVAVTLPPVAAVATLATIDGPFLACWAWAAVAVGRRRWPLAGLLCGIGVLAKPTMLLFPGCVGGWLLVTGRWECRFWWLIAGTAAGLAPIVGWNAAHGGVGLAHLAALGAGGGNPSPGLLGPADFVATQAAVLVGVWLVAWGRAVLDPAARTSLLWWLSVPVWLAFAVASLSAKPQANWPAAAYLTGLPLAVGWAMSAWPRRTLHMAMALGTLVGLAARFPQPVRPVFAAVAGSPTADRPAPVRRLDPTARLAGWRQLAAAVDRVREQVRAETGEEPLVAGMDWTLPGELAFYCGGRPVVYCFAAAAGGRHSQYDVWRPNPAADAQAFRGRAFVYVGELNPRIRGGFDRVGSPVEVAASDGGIPVGRWVVRACYGFRGFPATDAGRGF